MKNNIMFLFAAGIAAVAASCTDLDTPIESQYTAYPTSEAAQEAKLSDVYFHLRGTLGRRYMEAQALSSDEYVGISFGGDYYDSGTYAHACQHNYSADDASIGWFEDVTSGITKANSIISELSSTPDAAAGYSARAIRAYYQWILMDCYGNVPLLKSNVGDTVVVSRAKRAEVAQFIADELEAIIPHLTTEVSSRTYGKPTRYMAEALLAKLYINWPVYTASKVEDYDAANYTNPKLSRVIDLCDSIISSGKFDLTDSYLSKFYPNNGSQIKDFIYAMPFDAITATGMQYGRPRTWRKANTGTSYYGTTLSKSCGGNFSITPEMSDILMELSTDDRQGHVLADTIYMYDPTTYAKTTTQWSYKSAPVVLSRYISLADGGEDQLNVGNDTHGYCQGYKSVKWFIIDSDFKNDRNQSNDLPIFRYADILLMKAEALLRQTTKDEKQEVTEQTAVNLFNQIRNYVHAPSIDGTKLTLRQIYDERGREFFDENWRRNDMIRFGHFEDEYGFHKHMYNNARFDKTCRIFPIPTEVLKKNPTWVQNTGYNQ